MKYAIIENGIVANIAVADAPLAANWVDGAGAQIGDEYVGGEFVRPVIIDPVPESVTRRQAKVALLQAGLLDEVEAGIEAITDEMTRRIARIEWDSAQEVRRDWPLLVQIAGQIGITDEQLDDLFRAAVII